MTTRKAKAKARQKKIPPFDFAQGRLFRNDTRRAMAKASAGFGRVDWRL
jgi:hypothetical protein